jgi:hypothetical protein
MSRFAFLPWQVRPITYEQLLEQVHRQIARNGFWAIGTEYRMGGGPSVAIRPADQEGCYLVSATYGVTVSGVYESLDQALEAGAKLADAVWELGENSVFEGLVWPE